jgi:hypothetical protein
VKVITVLSKLNQDLQENKFQETQESQELQIVQEANLSQSPALSISLGDDNCQFTISQVELISKLFEK